MGCFLHWIIHGNSNKDWQISELIFYAESFLTTYLSIGYLSFGLYICLCIYKSNNKYTFSKPKSSPLRLKQWETT